MRTATGCACWACTYTRPRCGTLRRVPRTRRWLSPSSTKVWWVPLQQHAVALSLQATVPSALGECPGVRKDLRFAAYGCLGACVPLIRFKSVKHGAAKSQLAVLWRFPPTQQAGSERQTCRRHAGAVHKSTRHAADPRPSNCLCTRLRQGARTARRCGACRPAGASWSVWRS